MKYYFFFQLLTFFFLPLLVLGQAQPLPEPVVKSVSDIVRIIDKIADLMFAVLMIVAVIFIMIAGFYYLGGATDPAKLTKAHNILIWAAVAIAIGLIAKGSAAIVASVLTSRTPPGGGGGGRYQLF